MSNHQNRARLLLLTQLALIFSSASWGQLASFWLSVAFPFAFATSGALLANSWRWFFLYAGLWLIALVLQVTTTGPLFGLIQLGCSTGGFLLLFREIVRHSFFKPDVPRSDRILAGITGYLALGLFWFLVTVVTLRVHPEAFLNQVSQAPPLLNDCLYFSFVTLTTLGYGDILPTSPAAKIIVMLNSLSGVLYLAVFISALLGGNSQSKPT